MRDQGAEPNLCQLTKEEESSSTQLCKEAGLISINLSKEAVSNSTLSQLYSAANSTRLSKRRRVDIGVKRTVGYHTGGSAFTSDLTGDIAISPSHQASRAAAFLLQAMSQSGEGALVTEGNGNVLRKLLKRQADAYEDAMTPVTMTTTASNNNNNVISQLLHKRSATPPNTAHNSNSFPSPTSDEGVHDDSGSDPPSPRTHSHSRTLSSPRNGHNSPPSSARLSPPLGGPPERLNANTNTHTRTHTLPSPERERLSDEHLKAKRARVENIIRGIGHSPSTLATPTSSLCPAFSYSSSSSLMRGAECERDGSFSDGGEMLLLRENKRKQRLPQQQQQQQQQDGRHQPLLVDERSRHRLQERRQLKHQLEDMQKQLRQLQEKFFTVYDSTDSEGQEPSDDPRVPSNEPCVPSDDLSEDSTRSDDAGQEKGPPPHRRRRPRSDHAPAPSSEIDSAHFLQRARAHFLLRQRELSERALSQTPLSDIPPGPGEGRRLAETLKAELNSAVGQVVDSVVKVFAKPLPPQSRSPPLLMPSALELASLGGVPLPLPSAAADQTEALPLVVRKRSAETPQQHGSGLVAPGGLPPLPHPVLHPSSLSAGLAFAPQHAAFRPPFPLPLMGYPFQASYPGNKDSRGASPPDSISMEIYSSSASLLRSKMAASLHHHHLGQSQRAVSPNSQSGASSADGLSLSLIKAECNDLHDMSDMSPYSSSMSIQEGLSPNHLKKAKLMFFYSRYPSSNMLKIYFSDVKFNRCITSQLIKWFSNFREFYYIQMEKFARQAISEGVANSDDITVTRDSELFRVLNMHYNKANDYEVPERFLEVAEVTQREFFSAIAGGRDGDPSWKKAIYKVICKLDGDVPETFKSPHCLQELLHD